MSVPNCVKQAKFDIDTMGVIMRDMFDLAYSSDNLTWFIELEDKERYTRENWEEFVFDLKELDAQVDEMDCIIECPRDVDFLLNETYEPVATFYADFLKLFDEEVYHERVAAFEREFD